ncbi:MAG: DUF4920 domain-containing protein [Acidobacteria bacterium]|nr:DUF4920 domain-containing protein [Acidobacteriota bacterium]
MRAGFVVFLMASLAPGADLPIGKPLTLAEPTPLSQIAARPEKYAGQIVQVTGRVTEVCEMMGCWMNLVDTANQSIRIKVDDGEMVFPKTAVGKTAIAEGKLTRLQLTRDQAIARARHEAEEQGRKFNSDSIKSGATLYQIQGSGAVIRQ